MKTSKEMEKAVGNIQYYAKQIEELARKQLTEDIAMGHQVGINTNTGAKRFDSLGIINSDAGWIAAYCLSIKSNLEQAEKMDNKLYNPDEEIEYESGENTN